MAVSVLSDDLIEEFEIVTNFDLLSFYNDFNNFISNDYNNILGYYSGTLSSAVLSSFTNLNNLIDSSNQCLQLFAIHGRYFTNYGYWDLLDQIENIRSTLLDISNLNFFLRSNINKNQFNTTIQKIIAVGQNNTIEQSIQKNLGNSNANDDWVTIAKYNNLAEDDYTYQGGFILNVVLQNNDPRYSLQSVLGSLQGINLYGIDITAKLTYSNNDIQIDTAQQTVQNAINRYLKLKIGDNPEYPLTGISRGLVVGTDLGSLLFRVIFRQLTNTFQTDDTIYSFGITGLKYISDDSIQVDFQVQTKFGQVYNENITL